jgi:hypothetical protein
LQSYLSCLVPALILGIAQFSDRKSGFIAYPIAIALAIWTSSSIALMYTQNIVFMRATGLVYPVATLGCGIFAILAIVAFQLAKRSVAKDLPAPDLLQTPTSGSAPDLAPDLAPSLAPGLAPAAAPNLAPVPHSKSDRPVNTPDFITPLPLIAFILLVEAFTLPIVIKDSDARFENQPVQALHHRLTLKTDWVYQDPEPGKSPFLQTTFKKHNADGDSSTLQLATVMSNPQGTRILLRTLLTSAIRSTRFPGFILTSAETWNKYAPEALACQFTYENREATSTMAGFIVLVPRADGKTECYTLLGPRAEVEQEKWELAYAVSKLAEGQQH